MRRALAGFSALQRAEIAETKTSSPPTKPPCCFSALQRAEIAESITVNAAPGMDEVSVLFNEPKLLKPGQR